MIITTFSGNPNHFTILQDSQIATATGRLLPLAQTQHTDEPYFVQINSPARSTGASGPPLAAASQAAASRRKSCAREDGGVGWCM